MIDEQSYSSVGIEELNELEIEDYLLEVLDILENKFTWGKEDKESTRILNNYKRLIDKHNYSYLHRNYEALVSPNF